MPLNRVVEATELPVTVADARAWARLDPDVPDAEVEALILTAAQAWEHATGQVLTPSVWELTLDGFAADQTINLQTAPVIGIERVSYIRADRTEVELDAQDYQLDNRTRPCVLAPAPDAEWPTDALDDINVVTIRFNAGHASTDRRQKHWVCAMVATLNRHRESHAESPAMKQPFIDALLDPYRLPGV
jgi:uncharacterized phiE125 gp8 family phage protein